MPRNALIEQNKNTVEKNGEKTEKIRDPFVKIWQQKNATWHALLKGFQSSDLYSGGSWIASRGHVFLWSVRKHEIVWLLWHHELRQKVPYVNACCELRASWTPTRLLLFISLSPYSVTSMFSATRTSDRFARSIKSSHPRLDRSCSQFSYRIKIYPWGVEDNPAVDIIEHISPRL